jgi:hypothetical protein
VRGSVAAAREDPLPAGAPVVQGGGLPPGPPGPAVAPRVRRPRRWPAAAIQNWSTDAVFGRATPVPVTTVPSGAAPENDDGELAPALFPGSLLVMGKPYEDGNGLPWARRYRLPGPPVPVVPPGTGDGRVNASHGTRAAPKETPAECACPGRAGGGIRVPPAPYYRCSFGITVGLSAPAGPYGRRAPPPWHPRPGAGGASSWHRSARRRHPLHFFRGSGAADFGEQEHGSGRVVRGRARHFGAVAGNCGGSGPRFADSCGYGPK